MCIYIYIYIHTLRFICSGEKPIAHCQDRTTPCPSWTSWNSAALRQQKRYTVEIWKLRVSQGFPSSMEIPTCDELSHHWGREGFFSLGLAWPRIVDEAQRGTNEGRLKKKRLGRRKNHEIPRFSAGAFVGHLLWTILLSLWLFILFLRSQLSRWDFSCAITNSSQVFAWKFPLMGKGSLGMNWTSTVIVVLVVYFTSHAKFWYESYSLYVIYTYFTNCPSLSNVCVFRISHFRPSFELFIGFRLWWYFFLCQARLREVFNTFDCDKSGFIDLQVGDIGFRIVAARQECFCFKSL